MSAVWFRARTDLRSHWWAWVVLAVLVGLIAGGVTAAAAGARRTDSAYTRFLQATQAPQFLSYDDRESAFAHITSDQLGGIPSVAGVVGFVGYGVTDPADIFLEAPVQDGSEPPVGHKMLAGRQPLPERADEVMVSFTTAARHHLHVGEPLRLSVASSAQRTTPPVPVSFRVVGIEATSGEFPPQRGTGINAVWATPAFVRAHAGDIEPSNVTAVRLRRGNRDAAAFRDDVGRLAEGKPASVFEVAEQSVNTRHSIHLQAVALWVLCGLLGLAGALVTVQLLGRQTQLESGENPGLSALGMSRGQLWAVGVGRAVVIGIVGAVLAVVTAVVLSPLTPVGLARVAEPHPGFSLDIVALGLGALATVALVVLAGSWPAWRVAAGQAAAQQALAGQARPSAVTGVLSRSSAPVPLAAGVRLALEPGRGPTAVPVRSTLTGAAIGIVALTAGFGFTASLNHLLTTPRLYGISWDAQVIAGSNDITQALPAAQADPDVADASSGFAGFPVIFGAVRADGIALGAAQGEPLLPTPLQGRLPAAADEVVLGRSTLAALHAHVGGTVRGAFFESTGEPVTMRVVGVAVFPSLSDSMGLGKGVAVTPDGLHRLIPAGLPPPDTILVRFRPGLARSQAIAALQRQLGAEGFAVVPPERPTDLVNFGRVQTFPLLLGGVLAAFAVITLVHLLVTSIRRRRRDLAVLRTLGLTSAQVQATVAWQATTIAMAAILLGVPVGLAAARWVWLLFARQLGIVPEPAFPLLALSVLGVATILVANLVALLPGRVAARTSPALVLRSE